MRAKAGLATQADVASKSGLSRSYVAVIESGEHIPQQKTLQKLARAFVATDIVAERGEEAVARIKEMTKGIGADSVLECVGTQESMTQAIGATRPGGYVGYVGVPHGVEFKGEQLFFPLGDTPRS